MRPSPPPGFVFLLRVDKRRAVWVLFPHCIFRARRAVLNMRFEEKQRARELRRQGWSYNDILKEVGVSNSTLSLWLRDITLTDEQIAGLQCRQLAGREKFIKNERIRRDIRWAEFHRQAEEEYAALSQDPEFMFGLALYIGEGSKTSGNQLCLTNCNPRVIRKGLKFYEQIGVPRTAIHIAIQIHPGLPKLEAEAFWQELTGLPLEQFHTTREVVSRASKFTKGNLQVYGTCQLRAFSTTLRQKLARWMELALDNGPLV